jgi:hypothetical protein
MTSGGTPAGWYPDPVIPGSQRLWDGTRWTDSCAPMPPVREPLTAEKFHNLAYYVLWLHIISVVLLFFWLAGS